jgi:hypothetical protein
MQSSAKARVHNCEPEQQRFMMYDLVHLITSRLFATIHRQKHGLMSISTSSSSSLARMRVPKMANNGQNSRLHVSAGFDKDRCPKKSRTDMNSKTALKS